jgi:DNA-binding NarL/FixJ family response regulator
VRVHIAEGDPVYRQGLVGSIADHTGAEQVTQSSDLEALERIGELEPDVALLGTESDGCDAVAVLRRLRDRRVSTRVVVLSARDDGARMYEALQAGAYGYLLRGADGGEIWSALVAARHGESVIAPGLQQRLVRQIGGFAGDGTRDVSSREREILGLMADGLSNAAIGDRLHLSEGTVKTYLRRAYGKLGVSTRAAAIAQAMRLGIVH